MGQIGIDKLVISYFTSARLTALFLLPKLLALIKTAIALLWAIAVL
jgi:hypothetical protein